MAITVLKCKNCNVLPIIRKVGDWKYFFICECEKCGLKPQYNEADRDPIEAIKIWNKIQKGEK